MKTKYLVLKLDLEVPAGKNAEEHYENIVFASEHYETIKEFSTLKEAEVFFNKYDRKSENRDFANYSLKACKFLVINNGEGWYFWTSDFGD